MKKHVVLLALVLSCLTAKAQYNVERLITSGQVALHYEDYVLSIQYFNQVIAMKPFLYVPWQGRAAAKFSLGALTNGVRLCAEYAMKPRESGAITDAEAVKEFLIRFAMETRHA